MLGIQKLPILCRIFYGNIICSVNGKETKITKSLEKTSMSTLEGI